MRHYQAYRGYLITRALARDEYYITKDGCIICTKTSEQEAKAAIDELLD